MKKRGFFLIAILLIILIAINFQTFAMVSALVSPAVTATPVPVIPVGQTGNWKLIFNDEFTGTSLNTDKWTTCYWWDWANQGCTLSGNNELEWYQPDDVLVSDGLLHLRGQARTIDASDGNTYQYTSGMVSSGRSKVDPAPFGLSFLYGYAEIRAKLPNQKGTWPAFWMLPSKFVSKPEIDIIEVLGNDPSTVYMTLHYVPVGGGVGRDRGAWVGPDFSAGWHTFAVDWQPTLLVWYIDGVERWRYTNATYVPNVQMYLLLNLAVGGDSPGAPDRSTIFPNYYDIDYVRVWKRN